MNAYTGFLNHFWRLAVFCSILLSAASAGSIVAPDTVSGDAQCDTFSASWSAASFGRSSQQIFSSTPGDSRRYGYPSVISRNGLVMVAGSFQDYNSANVKSGIADVYTRPDVYSEFTLAQRIEGKTDNFWFGAQVDVSGDGMVIAITSPNDGPQSIWTGTTYIYRYDEATKKWKQAQSLTIEGNTVFSPSFGSCISFSQDQDSTTSAYLASSIVIGASQYDGDGDSGPLYRTGRAYVFDYDTAQSKYVLTATLEAATLQAAASFGYSCVMSADRKTVVVGAIGQKVDTTDSVGAAFVFKRLSASSSTFSTSQLLTPEKVKSGYEAAFFISISDDASIVTMSQLWSQYIFKQDLTTSLYDLEITLPGNSLTTSYVLGDASALIAANTNTGFMYVYRRTVDSDTGLSTGAWALAETVGGSAFQSQSMGQPLSADANLTTIVASAFDSKYGSMQMAGSIVVFTASSMEPIYNMSCYSDASDFLFASGNMTDRSFIYTFSSNNETRPSSCILTTYSSDSSVEVSTSINPAVLSLGAVQDLQATAGDKSVELTFSPPQDVTDFSTYEYYISVNAGSASVKNITSNSKLVTVDGLVNGQEYTFIVRVNNACGFGPASSVMATPTGPIESSSSEMPAESSSSTEMPVDSSSSAMADLSSSSEAAVESSSSDAVVESSSSDAVVESSSSDAVVESSSSSEAVVESSSSDVVIESSSSSEMMESSSVTAAAASSSEVVESSSSASASSSSEIPVVSSSSEASVESSSSVVAASSSVDAASSTASATVSSTATDASSSPSSLVSSSSSSSSTSSAPAGKVVYIRVRTTMTAEEEAAFIQQAAKSRGISPSLIRIIYLTARARFLLTASMSAGIFVTGTDAATLSFVDFLVAELNNATSALRNSTNVIDGSFTAYASTDFMYLCGNTISAQPDCSSTNVVSSTGASVNTAASVGFSFGAMLLAFFVFFIRP